MKRPLPQRILGGLAVLWGGALLYGHFRRSSGPSGGAYGAGRSVALVFAGVLLLIGLYYLLRPGPREG